MHGLIRLARGLAAFVLTTALLGLAVYVFVPHPLLVARLLIADPPEGLPVPVAGVSTRAMRDSWGAARSGGRVHQGIDIFARRGTPVLATTEGIVWRAGQNSLGGNVVWVLGPGRQFHYYAHLDGFAVDAGDAVKAGDLLGYVGNTGNARGGPTHLHYGIYRHPGGAINPYPLLAGGMP